MATAARYSGPEVRELREEFWPHMVNTRALATEARQLLAGKLGIVLPDTVTLAGAETWIGDLPHKRTGPQRVRQKLIAKQWEIKRPVTGAGPRAASVATRIEQPLNAIMKHKDAGFPWADINDLLLIEGIAFSTVSLAPTDWRQKSTLYKPSAKMSERKDGSPYIPNKYLEDRFAMDRKGRFRGDEGYDEDDIDVDAMRRDMEREDQDYAARHLPFRQRAYSIRQCAPVWGSDYQLEGLIVETNWSAHELQRRGVYVGKNKDGSDCQLYPLGAIGEGDSASGATGKQIKVIEAWMLDSEGLPYLTYYCEGKHGEYLFRKNRDSNNLEAWTQDLSKIAKDERGRWRGFSRLPISWGNGLGWSAADLDERALPFTKPFQQGWRMSDMLMTCIVASSMWLAFPALIEKLGRPVSDDDSLDEETSNTPDINMLKITQVEGDIINIGSQGPHPSVFQAFGILQGENKAEAPGGGDGEQDSGIGLSIAEAMASDALFTVNDSAMNMASENASLVLEGSVVLGECIEPVRVYQIADVLIEQKNPSDTDQMLVLEPGLVGSSYDVKAIEKKVPGENPAVRQQNAALVKERFYDRIWFLEQDGYSAPQEMAWRVQWEDLMQSEPGQQATLRMYTQYVSSKFVDQIQDAIAMGQASQQGLPVGAAQGTSQPPDMLMAGPQATGGMDGLAVPNPAGAQLGAVVNSGIQNGSIQNIANAGGELPATPLQGAVR